MEVPIVPVLFDDAAMPKASSLPRTMRQMAMLNAAIIGQGKAFRAGADGICDQVVRIKSSLGRASARATQSPKI